MTPWLLLVVLTADPSSPAVYTYTAEDGTVVFTDDLSKVPKHLQTPTGSPLPDRRPFPLADVAETAWRDEVPECHAALATVRTAQQDLTRAEAELNRRVTAFAPCQRFLDTCYGPELTLEAWRAKCQTPPTACEVNVEGMRDYVEALRDRVDELIDWLDQMAKWGCTRA